MGEERWLRYAALFYATGLALHTADHVRRGVDAVTPQVLWLGNISTLLGVTTVVLVLLGHRLGPLVAAITGLQAALAMGVIGLSIVRNARRSSATVSP